MNKHLAISAAQLEADKYGVEITVVKDLLSEHPDPDEQYAYAPTHAISLLYRMHEVVEVVKPDMNWVATNILD